MPSRSVVEDEIAEGSTPVFSFQILDADGDGFKPETLTVTLYDYRDKSIINSRDHVDILDVNGGSVDAEGNVIWELEEGDTPIVHSDSNLETHEALFEWSWDSGNSKQKHVIQHAVINLTKVPV